MCPVRTFVGYDLCPDAIEFAAREASRAQINNIRYEVRDLTGYDEVERFDFISSFDAVHDQKVPQDLIRRQHRALKPGHTYLMQDIMARRV